MNFITQPSFQREAHGDGVCFSVNPRTAGHRMAIHGNAQQGMASQRRARHRIEKQSNAVCALEKARSPGRFGPNAEQLKALQRITAQRIEWQGKAKQRGLATGNSRLSGSFWPGCKAEESNSQQRAVPTRIVAQGNASKRNSKQRGSPTGNSGFSGLLCPSGRVSPAALSTN